MIFGDDDLDDETLGCFAIEDCELDEPVEEAPATLAPAVLVPGTSVLAKTWNRLGGCIQQLAGENGIEPAAVLAVWRVESNGAVHVNEKAILRFENHLLWKVWGKDHQATFSAHWRFGSPQRWKGHEFREGQHGSFAPSHLSKGGQKVEYASLAKATELAGAHVALACASIGGCQILMSHWKLLGYPSITQMLDDFQTDEAAHVRGFMAFCKGKGIIDEMQAKKWDAFAGVYNGRGQMALYGGKIGAAYDEAATMLAGVAS